jgi:hypothetical protein
MKIYFSITLLLLITTCSCAQSKYLREIGDFLESQGEFSNEVKSNREISDLIFAVDLIKRKALTDQETGLYRVGVTASHARTYVLLIDQGNLTFLDLNMIDQELIKVIEYLKRSKFYKGEEKLDIVESILRISLKNKEIIPWRR